MRSLNKRENFTSCGYLFMYDDDNDNDDDDDDDGDDDDDFPSLCCSKLQVL